MKIRFLGAHNAESKKTRLVSLVIDNILAIDTGCITSELSYTEQEKIKAILLTHGHYDHIRGVPAFAFNNYCTVTPVYATQPALDMLASHLVDGIIYPKFTETTPMCDQRSLDFITLQYYKKIKIQDYQIVPFPMNHKLGAVGFEITDKQGKTIFISGDTGHGLTEIWNKTTPEILIIEVTFPNSREQTAIDAQHLCPKMLQNELKDFFKLHKYLPKIIVMHICPKLEKEIQKELQDVARELQHPIKIAYEGMTVNI